MGLRERVPHLEVLPALARTEIREVKAGAIVREAGRQALIFGRYACFQRREGRILACYGDQSGYPLGEMVRELIDEGNFIWCEPADPEQPRSLADPAILAVLVREGEVLLDLELPRTQLEGELKPILDADDTSYVFLATQDVLHLTGMDYLIQRAQEVRELRNSPLERMKRRPDLQLVPVAEALRRIKVVPPIQKVLTGAVAAAFLGAMVWVFWPEELGQPSKPGSLMTQIVDPWSDYRQALSSPSPEAVLKAALEAYLKLERAPERLRFATMEVEDDKLSASRGAREAPLSLVRSWARENGFQLTDAVRRPVFDIDLNLPPRPPPQRAYGLEDIQTHLEANVEMTFCDCELSFGREQAEALWRRQELRISFAGPPGLLWALGDALADLPLRLERLELNHKDIAEDLSGSVSLTLFGA